MRAIPAQDHPRTTTRRNFLRASIAASAGLALYSNEVSRHEIDVTFPTFYLPNLPPAFDGFRIAQISDLHLEEYTEEFFLRQIIARVNALAPDLVLITGDFVSRGPLPVALSYAAAGRCAELLTDITCPQRFGILGNHDVAVGRRIVRDHLENNGTPILVNQFVRIERNGQHIVLSGLDSYAGGYPNPTFAIPEKPDAPVIVMAHEPDFAPHLDAHIRGPLVSLILSGHTHGGQIRIPGMRPLALPPLGKLFPEGRYQVGASTLYVNRGIGTVGVPFRLNCPPEITLLTLKTQVS